METHFSSNSGGLQKKKVFAKIEADFLAKIVRFRLVGGMHPEIETDFWPKFFSVRLVGRNASPPPPPPKSATARKCCLLYRKQCNLSIFMPLQQSVCIGRIFLRLQNRIKQHVLKSTRSCFFSQKRLLSARWCKSFALTNIQSLATDSA